MFPLLLFRWQGKLLRRAKYGNMLAGAVSCCCLQDCRCADLPAVLCLKIITSGCAGLNGAVVRLDKLAGTCKWQFDGTLACGDPWKFVFTCILPFDGTLDVTPPLCMGFAGPINLHEQFSQCYPTLRMKFCYTQGPFGSGCNCCPTSTQPFEICFCVFN